MIRYIIDSIAWDNTGAIVYMDRKIYKSKYWADRYYDKQQEYLAFRRRYHGWYLTRHVTPYPDRIPDILEKISKLD